MFSFQNWQQKLAFAGFACLFTIIGMLLSPVTAQRDKFGDIECTSLKVVGADGFSRVSIGAGSLGGYVVVYDDDISGASKAELNISPRGGYIKANGKDGVSTVVIDFNAHGGILLAHGKGKGKVAIEINENGNGAVSTWDNNGNQQ